MVDKYKRPTPNDPDPGMDESRRRAQQESIDQTLLEGGDQSFLEQTREDRGKQIRGTGDMPPPVHGATRPVETSADVAEVDVELHEQMARDREGAGTKVRAIRLGYYDDKRRRTGDVFTIYGEDAFSPKWMERVDGRTPERLTSGKQALKDEHDANVGAAAAAKRRGTGDRDVLTRR